MVRRVPPSAGGDPSGRLICPNRRIVTRASRPERLCLGCHRVALFTAAIAGATPTVQITGLDILAVLVFLVPFIIFAAMAIQSHRNNHPRR